ncbi:MAG: hypothetical protein DKT66_22865 [Candidatus Melainabacteria bacterium]|nr:MAG: hypothetical protein DKT66_22865 [Candidatus Melainabacteria bacterium]
MEREWASKKLVCNLVKKEKYELAGYVVLGEKVVFEMYSNWISDTESRTRDTSEDNRRRELSYIIEMAKEEIREHRKWQEEVLSSLPRKDDALGLTGPLRLAFADASDARKALLQEVMVAHGKFIEPACDAVCLQESLQASAL